VRALRALLDRRERARRGRAVVTGLRLVETALRLGRAEVYVGTCSWADPHFVREGAFYPRGVRSKPDLRLRYYATVFPAVEVDATYYALLPADYARRYAAWTPEGFRFGVKAFGLLTGHGADPKRLPPHIQAFLPEEAVRKARITHEEIPGEVETLCWEAFLEFCRTLWEAGRLGYVLFQFPRWTAYSRGVLRYLEHVRERLQDHPVAVEWRHRSWVEGAVRWEMARALRELGMACVVADCPPLDWAPPLTVEITAPWSVARLHGRNAAGWQPGAGVEAAYDYLYSEEELHEWAGRARGIAARVDRLFVMFNNCTRGQAAVNAARMVDLLASA